MQNVVFVAPFFAETTLRFVNAAAARPGSRLTLVSQDPQEKLPPSIRVSLAGHYLVRDALDPACLRKAIEQIATVNGPVDRLLGTLEELQVPLGGIRDALGIPGMGAGIAANFRDKFRMKSVLHDAGLPCARFRLVRSLEEAQEFAGEVGYPLIVKSPEGSGARGTYRVADRPGLKRALGVLRPSADRPALAEEFMTGREHSFDSVFVGGRMAWYSINRYLPSPLEVLREPWIQWAVLSPREVDAPEYHEIRRVAESALRALGMRDGLSHMEWFLRPDGTVAISEAGARPPGAQFTSLISWAHDLDFYAAWAKLMISGEFDPPPRPYAVGAAYLRGQGNGRVAAVHGMADIAAALGPLIVEAHLPRKGQAPSTSYEGDGYVIVRHPETSVVEEALARIVSTLRVELTA